MDLAFSITLVFFIGLIWFISLILFISSTIMKVWSLMFLTFILTIS